MNKINIQGTCLGNSGYDHHTRCLANACHEIGIDVRLDVPRPQGWEQQVTDAELSMINSEFDKDCLNLMIAMPQFWRYGWSDNCKKFAGFCVWEGDKVPKFWKPFLLDDRTDYIFVPSTHVKQAILNTFKDVKIKAKIHIIPHGVDINVFTQKEYVKQAKDNPKPLVFFANKGWSKGMNDRGGIQYTLKAFTEEFTNKDNVELRLKINPGYNPQGWDFAKELNKLGIKEEGRPKIFVNMDVLPTETLVKMYQDCDVFVSSTMADGFGLPTLEAMSCGLPCIQTNYGGQTDFVNEQNGLLVDYKLVPVKDDFMYEHVKWATPNIQQLRAYMRLFYNNRGLAKTLGMNASLTAKKFLWRDSAKKIKEIIKK